MGKEWRKISLSFPAHVHIPRPSQDGRIGHSSLIVTPFLVLPLRISLYDLRWALAGSWDSLSWFSSRDKVHGLSVYLITVPCIFFFFSKPFLFYSSITHKPQLFLSHLFKIINYLFLSSIAHSKSYLPHEINIKKSIKFIFATPTNDHSSYIFSISNTTKATV